MYRKTHRQYDTEYNGGGHTWTVEIKLPGGFGIIKSYTHEDSFMFYKGQDVEKSSMTVGRFGFKKYTDYVCREDFRHNDQE
jgi:hypothetical protein